MVVLISILFIVVAAIPMLVMFGSRRAGSRESHHYEVPAVLLKEPSLFLGLEQKEILEKFGGPNGGGPCPEGYFWTYRIGNRVSIIMGVEEVSVLVMFGKDGKVLSIEEVDN